MWGRIYHAVSLVARYAAISAGVAVKGRVEVQAEDDFIAGRYQPVRVAVLGRGLAAAA